MAGWQRTESNQDAGERENPGHRGRNSDGQSQHGEEGEGAEQNNLEEHQVNANWDQAANLKQVQDPTPQEIQGENTKWGKKDEELQNQFKAESSKDVERRNENRSDNFPQDNPNPTCRHCGLRNHTSENCLTKTQCEICGYNNHITIECKREPLGNMGPELCAAQVEDQSFFYME